MTIITLNRVDKGHAGEKWQLNLEGRSAQLQIPDGQVAASFTPEEAYRRFELIRFSTDLSGNGHNFGITDGQNTWHFVVWPNAFKKIKAFVQQSPEASSQPELGKVRRRAIFETAFGSIGVAGGGILSLLSYLDAADNVTGGEYYIFYGAAVTGILFLFMGYYHFAEHRKLQRTPIRTPASSLAT